ncbi:MAG: Glutamate racemase [Firmicutes bacterium]|nr:Glutamate racemase [Bacillota bacterium]
MKIGFFDSGIGGTTVLYQALKILPNEDYVYYADTAHVPYGEKTKSEIKNFMFEAIDFIVSQNTKAIVIACNTGTSAAITDLRQKYNLPIIGIEPAVKPAIQKSHQTGRRVLALATNFTLKEEKFNNLVTNLDNEHIVDGLALPGLVEFAEKFQFQESVVMPYLVEQLEAFDLNCYETVVLGCTHFPLYKDILRKLFPQHVDIIDGSVGTVNNLKRTLAEIKKIGEGSGKITFYQSGIKLEDPEIVDRYIHLLDRMRSIDA